MLHIYYGREKTEREKFIFDNIEGKTLLLVPDQFSLQAEKDAFFYLKEKSLIDLQIVDFSTLGNKVVRETDGKRPHLIDKYGRHMILAGIVRDLDKDLRVYKGYHWKNSFLDMLNGLISEMKRYEVSPEDLQDVLDSLDDDSYLKYKLTDICAIYSAYQERISGRYLDSEDYISFYGERILKASMVREAEIWIYGFDTFTPKNLLVIERLLKASRGVNIVFTYEEENDIFELTKYQMERFKELAEDINEPVDIAEIDDKPEGMTRKTVWDHDDASLPVSIVEASDMYAEAERAAAYILKLVREEGYKFGDIVVVCNDTGVRSGILKRTFMRWDIPVFMDRKRRVLHHQAVGFLLALMEIIAEGYREEPVMRLIKSPLMGIEREDISLLENYAVEFKIKGSRWKEPFTKLGDKYDDETLKKINDLREYLVGVIGSAGESVGSRNSASEKIRGLYEFLRDDFGILDKIEETIEKQENMGLTESAAETAQSWSVICNIFDQITEIMGQDKTSNRELLRLMEAGFETVEIGLVPVSSDCVIVGTLQRTRMSRIKAILVVGANDGVLPLGVSSEGLISEREKDVLESHALEISKKDNVVRQEEKLALHRTFCLPDEKLYISCSGVNEEGEELRPSEVFRDVERYMEERTGNVSVLGDLADEDDVFEMVASRKGTMSYVTDVFKQRLDGREIEDDWLQVINWYDENDISGFSQFLNGTLFDNREEALGREFADSLYMGDRQAIEVSASRLEKYSGCPFAHFIEYGLRAESRRVYEMSGREIGEIYHMCLMEFSEGLTGADGKGGKNIPVNDPDSMWMTISEDECRRRVEDIIKEDAERYREGVLVSGREEEYKTGEIIDICSRAAWALVQQVRRGRIKDMRFEYPFYRGRELAPVKISLDGRDVYITGKIDRMDVMDGDYVRIIDYKTGEINLEKDDFESGYELQLMIYLKAAMEGGKSANGGRLKPAGVFYFHIDDPDADADKDNIDEAADAEKTEKRIIDSYSLKGFMPDDSAAIDAMDGKIGEGYRTLPVKGVKNGKYVMGKAEDGKLMSGEEFERLYSRVEEQVQRICGEICDGNIDIKPARKRKSNNEFSKNACRFCEYKGICMFE